MKSCGILDLAEALAKREIVRRRRRLWSDLREDEAEGVWRVAFDRRVRMPVLQREMELKGAQLAADPLNGALRRQYETLRGEWHALTGAPDPTVQETMTRL